MKTRFRPSIPLKPGRTDAPIKILEKANSYQLSREEFGEFVSAHNWTFAKTMPKHPHHYLVREGLRNDEEWMNAVRLIRQYGYDEFWFKTKIRYLDFEGERFWTMGYTEDSEDILNKATNTGPPWRDRPWIFNKDVLVEKDPIPAGYPKFAKKAGGSLRLVK